MKIEGKVEEDLNLIENEVTTFFKALFNGYHDRNLINTGMSFVPDLSSLPAFLNNLEKLPDIDRDEPEHEMTLDELEFIVQQSKNTKVRGWMALATSCTRQLRISSSFT